VMFPSPRRSKRSRGVLPLRWSLLSRISRQGVASCVTSTYLRPSVVPVDITLVLSLCLLAVLSVCVCSVVSDLVLSLSFSSPPSSFPPVSPSIRPIVCPSFIVVSRWVPHNTACIQRRRGGWGEEGNGEEGMEWYAALALAPPNMEILYTTRVAGHSSGSQEFSSLSQEMFL
jgi:hypothetical protein